MENTVFNWLVEQVKDRPDKVAIIYKGQHITYRQIFERAKEVRGWLKEKRIEQGDRVLICAKNSDKFIYILFGILMNQSCFVPINPKIDKEQLSYIIKNCSPTCILTEEDVKASDLLEKVPYVTVANINECYVKVNGQDALDVGKEDNLAAIIYTSGTSKYPKGVVEHNRQIVFATQAINKVIGNTQEDTILCGLPLSFDYGLYQVFLSFQVGATLVLEEDFSICANIPKLLYEYGVTGFPGVPSLFNLLILSRAFEYGELPQLRYLTSTGDTFRANTICKLQELLPGAKVYPMYGLTECKRVSIMPHGYDAVRPTAVGLPLPGVTVKVVDENEKEVPCGEIGQLVVKGSNVMSGYWNNFEDTIKKYHYDERNEQVLLFTGDLFYLDEEGYLYFAGRKENFIKSRGYKVSPIEVEQVLCSIQGVSQAAVFGVPDSVMGEKVCAAIQITKKMEKEFILNACREKMQAEKVPTALVISFRELPKTINGKVDYKGLKKSFLGEN